MALKGKTIQAMPTTVIIGEWYGRHGDDKPPGSVHSKSVLPDDRSTGAAAVFEIDRET